MSLSPSELEDVLASILDADDQGAALDEACARHPEHADLLRRTIEELRNVNLLTDSSEALAREQQTIGGYRILDTIGRGGMGVVYRASDPSIEREVALKVLRPELLHFEDSLQRFRREIDVVARLRHPGIVGVHSAGEDHGVPFFTMELVAGTSLSERIQGARGRTADAMSGSDLVGSRDRTGSSSMRRVHDSWTEAAVDCIRSVAETLQFAHGHGVYHRDVKPSNILIDEHGHAKVVDFGLARLDDGQQLTRSTAVLGSLPYLSPEQISGQLEEHGARQDVYSLGVTLYELLTLVPPFLGATGEETRRRIANADCERPSRLNRSIGRDLETVVRTAMEPDPERRYASCAAFAADLENVLARRPILARPAGPALRTWRWAQRHPTATVAIALGFLLLVVVPIMFGVYHMKRADEAAEREAQLAKRTDEFKMLKNVVLLRVAEQAEAELYPAWPERVDAMQAWLDESWAEIAETRDRVTATLDALRARALDAEATELEFAATEDRFLWETLSEVDADIARFEDELVEPVRERIEWAGRVDELTISHPNTRVSWVDAAAAIRHADGSYTSALYRGDEPFELEPQRGLVPLGVNPRTKLWEFYHLRSAEDPLTLPVHDPETGWIDVEEGTGIVFVLVPGGTGWMGAQSDDPDGRHYDPLARSAEGPPNEFSLDPYFLARHEITQGQWTRLSGGSNPSGYKPPFRPSGGEPVDLTHPVENSDWATASGLCERHGLILPTEAQWEFACRAGSDTPWWTGRDRETLRGAINIADATAARARTRWPACADWPDLEDGFTIHAPVDTKRANPWGFHHMAGNINEWCLDVAAKYGKGTEPGTGLRRVRDDQGGRMQRGGAYDSTAAWIRSASRNLMPRESRHGSSGVRPARRLQ